MRTDAVVRILAGFLKRAWASACSACTGTGAGAMVALIDRCAGECRGAIEGDEAFMIVVSVYLGIP